MSPEYVPRLKDFYNEFFVLYSNALKKRESLEEVKVYTDKTSVYLSAILALKSYGLFSEVIEAMIHEDVTHVIDEVHENIIQIVELTTEQKLVVSNAKNFLLFFNPKK